MLIDRFMILHLNLVELSTGKALDESASNEELLEQILYFYSSKACTSNVDSGANSISSSNGSLHSFTSENFEAAADHLYIREAIQFAGLCTALYKIPESINCDDHDGKTETSRTSEVHLTNCSLFFQPLEEQQSSGKNVAYIIAVAQICKASRDSSSLQGQNTTGTPMAVGTAIKRSHNLFCLLRGGGIHNRLRNQLNAECQKSNVNNDTKDKNEKNLNALNFNNLYSELGHLYNLRKSIRRLNQQISRSEYDGDDAERDVTERTKEELKVKEVELDDLSLSHPTRSLKEDLRVHYDTFLGDHAHGACGVYRNLVEGVPPPMPSVLGTHANFSAPLTSPMHPDEAMELSLTIRKLLSTQKQVIEKPEVPQLLGVTAFAKGQMVFPSAHMTTENGLEKYSVSNETNVQLMCYLCQFRYEMHQQRGNAKDGMETFRNETYDGFLSPPPLSLMSSLDDDNESSFDGPRKINVSASSDNTIEDKITGESTAAVWAPRVHLPLISKCGIEDTSTRMDSLAARIAVFYHGSFAFLLYLNDSSGGNKKIYQPLFYLIKQYLGTSLDLMFPTVSRRSPTASLASHPIPKAAKSRLWQEPGQTIIAVDRSTESLILFPDPKNDGELMTPKSSIRQMAKGQPQVPERRGMSRLFFKPPQKSKGTISKQRSLGSSRNKDKSGIYIANSSMPDPLSIGLDCRHRLASQLSLDSLLAFEDAINEVTQRRNACSNNFQSGRKDEPESQDVPFEMCTLLSGRWVYAMADGEKELYVLFNSTYFVTVSDVQIGAQKIRTELLGLN